MDHLCYLCLVFVMLSRQFIAALWSPAGKGLTSWLLSVMFNCVLSLSNVECRVSCGTCLYIFLIFAAFLTLYTYDYEQKTKRKSSRGILTLLHVNNTDNCPFHYLASI